MIKRKVAFLSTYPSRECGLATFTQDLVRELDKNSYLEELKIIAVSDNKYEYENKVITEILQDKREDYLRAAKFINSSDIELVVIEHEYGIFGGDAGEYIFEFVNNLEVPVITTLHTVLSEPSEKQKNVLRMIGEKSERIVTMAKNTIPLLRDVYGIDQNKIKVIHHGVPYKILESRDKLKEKHNLKERNVVTTFGLLGPNKGLEYAIEAVGKVVNRHKNLKYLILGQTHPCVKKECGEVYRNKLIEMVDQLGISENVQFVDKYLSKEEVIKYLKMSDIYITPYLFKEQAVSGTLAYAVGYGRVVISTPYNYAKEMLSEGRGILVEFFDADSLANGIKYVLENPEMKKDIENKTLSLGKTMMWNSIAEQYVRLFIETLEKLKHSDAMVV